MSCVCKNCLGSAYLDMSPSKFSCNILKTLVGMIDGLVLVFRRGVEDHQTSCSCKTRVFAPFGIQPNSHLSYVKKCLEFE